MTKNVKLGLMAGAAYLAYKYVTKPAPKKSSGGGCACG